MVGAASGLWTIWILCRTWWKKVVGIDHGAASGLWTIWILCRTWWKKVVGIDHSDYRFLPVLWEGAVSAVP